jgi:hypothetical protein
MNLSASCSSLFAASMFILSAAVYPAGQSDPSTGLRSELEQSHVPDSIADTAREYHSNHDSFGAARSSTSGASNVHRIGGLIHPVERFPTMLEIGFSISLGFFSAAEVRFRFNRNMSVGVDDFEKFEQRLISQANREVILFSPVFTYYPRIPLEKMRKSNGEARFEPACQAGVTVQFLEGGMLPPDKSLSLFVGTKPRLVFAFGSFEFSMQLWSKLSYLAYGNGYTAFHGYGLSVGEIGGCAQKGAWVLTEGFGGSIGLNFGGWR